MSATDASVVSVARTPPRRRVSSTRVAGALTIGIWAGLFWFVLLTGRALLYVGTRTIWIVPTGAVLFSIAFLGRLSSLRTAEPEPVSTKTTLLMGLLVLPAVVLFAMPSLSLGSFAVGKRAGLSNGGFAAASVPISATGDLSMIDVAGALVNRDSMAALAQRAGSTSSFTGFVSTESGEPANEFLLNRFVVSCCVADALGVQIRIANAPPGEFKPDDWVQVTGAIYPVGSEVVLIADDVTRVRKPKHPYISP